MRDAPRRWPFFAAVAAAVGRLLHRGARSCCRGDARRIHTGTGKGHAASPCAKAHRWRWRCRPTSADRHRSAGQAMAVCRRAAAKPGESPTSTATRASRRGRPTGGPSRFRAIAMARGASGRSAGRRAALKAVTSGPFDDREPHWSPDGTRSPSRPIAAATTTSGSLDVASGAVAADHARPGQRLLPGWSPDGREIAFVSTRASAPGVYAITLDGRGAAGGGVAGTASARHRGAPGGQVLFSVVPATGSSGSDTSAPGARRAGSRHR